MLPGAQDLMSSVELERLQQGEYRASQLSAKQAKEMLGILFKK